MNIIAENLGKRFGRDWIFKGFNYQFIANRSYAITGPNGSGKSTLLQIIAGIIPPTTGTFSYKPELDSIEKVLEIHHCISITTPFQELIEEFTLLEFLKFHTSRKKFKNDLSCEHFAEKITLKDSLNKEIRYFSSGMKQKVKLGLSLYAQTPILMLDEPTNNLDRKGIDWYLSEICQAKSEALVIICSNQEFEYDFCDHLFALDSYK